MVAIVRGHLEVVQYLLTKVIDVDSKYEVCVVCMYMMLS